MLPSRIVYIPKQVKRMTENAFLRQFDNKPIREAKTEAMRVHSDAFRWHMDNLVQKWE